MKKLKGYDKIGTELDKLVKHRLVEEQNLLLNLQYYWHQILSNDMAQRSWPVKISTRRDKKMSTLKVYVPSEYALEFQHISASMLEKIHSFLGSSRIHALEFTQIGALPKQDDPIYQVKSGYTDEKIDNTVVELIEHSKIEDESLKKALYSFGLGLGSVEI